MADSSLVGVLGDVRFLTLGAKAVRDAIKDAPA